MIHHSSNDPVLIKKISLRIWSLRDEIESRIQNELEKNPENEVNLENIKNEYSKKSQQINENNVVELKPNTDLDNSEDEMAKAMRGELPEENPEMPSESSMNEENTESAEVTESTQQTNVVSLNKNEIANPNIIEINIQPPPIEEAKIARGKTVLSEITMDKMFLFSNRSFTEGQSIAIQFCIPKTFYVYADVLYCRPFNLKSRIISSNNYNFRVLIKFTFIKDGERALLRQFLNSIEPDVSKVEKKSENHGESSDETSFGELDDLGL